MTCFQIPGLCLHSLSTQLPHHDPIILAVSFWGSNGIHVTGHSHAMKQLQGVVKVWMDLRAFRYCLHPKDEFEDSKRLGWFEKPNKTLGEAGGGGACL